MFPCKGSAATLVKLPELPLGNQSGLGVGQEGGEADIEGKKVGSDPRRRQEKAALAEQNEMRGN